MKLPFRESEENWPDISANSGPPIVSHRWLSFVYKKTIMAVTVLGSVRPDYVGGI